MEIKRFGALRAFENAHVFPRVSEKVFEMREKILHLPSWALFAFAAILLFARGPAFCLAGSGSGTNFAGAKLRIVQINDVYDAGSPVEDSLGGLDRVAWFVKAARIKDANTVFVHAGDAINPSAFNAAEFEGSRLNGRHMIDVLNRAGVDLIVPGNHEFDMGLDVLKERIAESKAVWINSNILEEKSGAPLKGTVPFVIREFSGSDGKIQARVAFIGVSIGSSERGITVVDPIKTVRKYVEQLRNQVDVIVVVSHLRMAQDEMLARSVPGISLIIGGHDHEGFLQKEATTGVPIAKAQSNARTLVDHLIQVSPTDHGMRAAQVDSQVIAVDSSMKRDPEVRKAIERWKGIARAYFKKEGFDLDHVLYKSQEDLIGIDAVIRTRHTNLSSLILESMFKAIPEADVAVIAGGSIRIDDVIPAGSVTEFDVLRIFPRGDDLVGTRVSGVVLEELLRRKTSFSGTSIFHTKGATESNGKFLVKGKPLDPNSTYLVVGNDHLAMDLKVLMEKSGARADNIVERNAGDIRLALKNHLRSLSPRNPGVGEAEPASSACLDLLLNQSFNP